MKLNPVRNLSKNIYMEAQLLQTGTYVCTLVTNKLFRQWMNLTSFKGNVFVFKIASFLE